MRVAPFAKRFLGPARRRSCASPYCVSMRRRSPQLREAAVASAAGPVVVVANRILDVVVLVILLRRPELGRDDDRRDDRVLERLRLLERRLRRLGGLPLLVVVHQERGAILS